MTSAAAKQQQQKKKQKKKPPLLPPFLLPSLPKFYSGAKLSKAKAKLLDLIAESGRGTRPSPSRAEVEAAIDELYAVAPRSSLFPLKNNPAGIDGKWKLVSSFLSIRAGGGDFEKRRNEKKRVTLSLPRSPFSLLVSFFFIFLKKNSKTKKKTKVWTSEKEVLWVIANGRRLFGVEEVGEVFQTLSLAESDDNNEEKPKPKSKTPALINEIVFPPGGSFVVNSGARARESVENKETAGSRVDFKFSGARLDVAKVDKETGECAPAFSLPLPPFGQGWFDTVIVEGGPGCDLRIARDVRGDTLICVRAEE